MVWVGPLKVWCTLLSWLPGFQPIEEGDFQLNFLVRLRVTQLVNWIFLFVNLSHLHQLETVWAV